jgi:mannose-6-phosphate isomerase-like protein (cupin superfamily)
MTEEGKSVVISDEQLEPLSAVLLGGGGMCRLWAGDEPMSVPRTEQPRASANWFPSSGGFRFALVVFGPEGPQPPDLDMNAAVGELSEKFPGLVETLDPRNPAMHASDTVDFNFVVCGEIYLELDNGREILLKAGDCVIQNGTRHAWHNRASEPCTMAVALIGAERIQLPASA